MRSVPLLLVVVPIACVFDSSPEPTRPPAETAVRTEVVPDPSPPKVVVPRGGAGLPDQPEPAAVTMEYCASPGCAITFDFAAAHPDAKVVFVPAQAGKQTWRTPTQLVFEPAKGAMLGGHKIVATVPTLGFTNQLEVPFFEAVGKVARWPVQPGKPRFVAFLNGFSSQIGRGALIGLYDQPIDPDAVARTTKVTSGGRRIPVSIRRPASTAIIDDRPIDRSYLVALELERDRLPSDGDVVAIEMTSFDDAGAPHPQPLELTVNTTLTGGTVHEQSDDNTTKGRRVPLGPTLEIPLSNQVTSNNFAKHFTIEPKPASVSTRVGGVTAWVSAQLEPGTLYTLTVDDDLHDVLGNKLRSPIVASFRSQDAEPALFLPSTNLVLESGRAKLPMKHLNVGSATIFAHRFESASEFVSARQAGGDCPGDGKPLVTTGPLNQLVSQDIALEPGLYCIGVAAKGRGSQAAAAEASGSPSTSLDKHIYTQVTSLGLTAKVYDEHVFAWLTRLADGRPVGSTKVALVDEAGKELASGTTAADGTVTLDKVDIATNGGLSARAQLVAGDGQLVASFADTELSHARSFGLDGRVRDAEPLITSLFTERGVYRPGEVVHVKALVRDPGTYHAASGDVGIAITDARGEKVMATNVTLDSFGGAAVELALKTDAKVGAYTVTATQGSLSAVRTFRVEEYRVPTFAVTVATDTEWSVGKQTTAAVAASYLHGGPLAGREVSWEITRTPEPFSPPGLASFIFGDISQGAPQRESLGHGAGKLDGQGHVVVSLRPDVGPKAGAMRYSVEAKVTDVDRQVYAGTLSKLLHPADVYVGVVPPQMRVVAAGDTLTLPVVAVTPAGATRAGVPITVALERVDYHGVTRVDGDAGQRVVRPVSTVVTRCEVTSAVAPVTCKLPIASAGDYVVRASGEDAKHRRVEAAFAVSASGGTPVAWPRFDHERIQIVADKASYKPGDTARLIVQSPFPDARGLLTIERDGVLEHRVFSINSDTPELRVPITEASAPNVFASVVIVRGRIHDAVDATGFATGAPAFRLGYVQLLVEPSVHRLDVVVTPASPKAYPGGTLGVDVAIKAADGKPRAGQATVMVVDEAGLGLTRYRTPNPLAELFAPRPLGVRTGESRLDMLDARRSRRERVFPAGDGGGDMAMAGASAPLPELPSDLRKLFDSTAYFNPAVAIGPDGKAHLEIKLPDNVTTYRIMAVAVDAESRAGAGQGSVIANKPLLVLPTLPRFVHPGDRLQLEAHVFNASDTAGALAVTQTLTNMQLATGDAKQASQLAANAETKLAYQVVVPEDAHGKAKVAYSATLGSFHDAVEIELPIVEAGADRKIVVSQIVNGSDKLVVPLPDDRRPGTMSIEISASSTPLSELKDSVQYLMDYPNGCIEQTTSTAYPLVVLRDLLPAMGVTVDNAKLEEFSHAGVKRILSFQTAGGGLSYWPGGTEPHAYATAFGLTALLEAKKRGYDVPDAALAKMADFLETTLRGGTISGEMPHGSWADGDTRAFFVMTLGRLGRPQPGYISTLWDRRKDLTSFGLAFLAVAVEEGAGDKRLLQPMLDALQTAATEEAQLAHYDGKPGAGFSMSSPLRTHAGALLSFAMSKKADPFTSKLLRGLLARQQGGRWGNTQENVFGIMAVAQMAKSAATAPAATLAINGKSVAGAQFHDAAGGAKRMTITGTDYDAAKQLVVELGSPAPVYATIRVEYVAKLDAAHRAPRKHGFAMTRSYETMDGTSLDGKRIKLGSLVRVRLAVHADKANHYVAIDDKLPAGLEPLNAALATTESVSTGKLSAAAKLAASVLSYSEIRDARVAFYIDDMAPGDYELIYVARATTPGSFIRPASLVEAMYDPETNGSSSIDDIVVE